MSSLRLLFGFAFLIISAAAGCGDDDGGDASSGGSGTGGSQSPDASGVVDVLTPGQDRPNPGLADGGAVDADVPSPADGGTNPPTTTDAGPGDCGNGRLDGSETCDPGIDPCCRRTCDGPVADGVICRAAAGDCDVAEECNGRDVSCPRDEVVDEGEECRPADGDCDVAEECDGEDVDCPDDEVEDEGEVCRPADGACDVAEECDGEERDCPDDEVADEGEVCRPVDGECDVAEECDGEDVDCPSDEFDPLGTPCRPAATTCDEPEECTGEDADCPSNEPAAAATPCRTAVDGCDAAESCPGGSFQCPPDLPGHCAASVLAGALPLSVSGTTGGTCATYMPTCVDPEVAPGNSNERVYMYTAPAAGTYRFDTLGSGFDTVLALRNGVSCGATELGCADDVIGGGRASVVEATLTASQTVMVMVDGYNGASGSFTLTIRDASEYEGWTCSLGQYAGGVDNGCHCGCGIADLDCTASGADACDDCSACREDAEACDGSPRLDQSDTSQCTGWICPNAWYDAGDGCDCGCGALDPDCANADPAQCDSCTACGDASYPCGGSANVDDEDNTQCTTTWSCPESWYGGGDGCDCACGIFDPDCVDHTSGACSYCGSVCGADIACAVSVDANNNAACAPEVPGWNCDPTWYDSGLVDDCDCGCGIPDPDCASAASSECDYCQPCHDWAYPCTSSPSVVADDNTRCQ